MILHYSLGTWYYIMMRGGLYGEGIVFHRGGGEACIEGVGGCIEGVVFNQGEERVV